MHEHVSGISIGKDYIGSQFEECQTQPSRTLVGVECHIGTAVACQVVFALSREVLAEERFFVDLAFAPAQYVVIVQTFENKLDHAFAADFKY